MGELALCDGVTPSLGDLGSVRVENSLKQAVLKRTYLRQGNTNRLTWNVMGVEATASDSVVSASSSS